MTTTAAHQGTQDPPEPDTYSVAEAAQVLGISRGAAYDSITAKTFPVPVIRIGRNIRVPRRPLDALVGNGD